MDKEEKKNNLIVGVSAAVGSTLSSSAAESVMIKNEGSDEQDVAVTDNPDISTDRPDNDLNIYSSIHEESGVTLIPTKDDVQSISPEDIIIDPESVMYGGPVIDDEDLVVIDIDDNIYGGPVDDIEVIYGGPIPDDIEPVDIDCDIYGGPVDII